MYTQYAFRGICLCCMFKIKHIKSIAWNIERMYKCFFDKIKFAIWVGLSIFDVTRKVRGKPRILSGNQGFLNTYFIQYTSVHLLDYVN